MVTPNVSTTEYTLAGEPGSFIGWAKIRPDSFRFVRFVSPRTNTYGAGLFVLLEGDAQEVWVNRQGVWKPAEGWQRRAYMEKYQKEAVSGKVDNTPLADAEVGQI